MGNYKNKQEFQERVIQFKLLVKEGRCFHEAVKESKISKDCAYVLIRKEGLEVKRRNLGNCNDTYFKEIDTQEKAYLLGFILADGSINKSDNRIAINNSIDDEEVVIKAQQEICPKMKVNYRENAGKKKTCILRWSSPEMKNDLSTYNIKPNKTYDFDFTFPFEKVPENLQRHFIRGFFDGDGCLSTGRLEFITTSREFAIQIADIFKKEFDVEIRLRERQTKNVVEYMFYFHANWKRKQFLQRVYKWFYVDSTIHLNRKKKKFELFLNTEVIFDNNILETP